MYIIAKILKINITECVFKLNSVLVERSVEWDYEFPIKLTFSSITKAL